MVVWTECVRRRHVYVLGRWRQRKRLDGRALTEKTRGHRGVRISGLKTKLAILRIERLEAVMTNNIMNILFCTEC